MDNWQRDLDAFILQRMAAAKLPAVSLALVRDGGIIYRRGYGMRDWQAGLPATPATLYGIGSVTKSFTCIAVMQLQEQGLLSIDDPVAKYLPLTITPLGGTVLLRHLMSHTSGIPALGYAEHVLRQVIKPRRNLLLLGGSDDMLAFLADADGWAHARPGERWFYLNEGFALLGAIVSKVSGQPYVEYVRQHILALLGMDRSHYARAPVKADPDVAVPSYIDRDGRPQGADYCYGQIDAEGGLISSVDDMARYIQMFLRGGVAPGGARVITETSLAEMYRPRVATPGQYFEPLSGPVPQGNPVAGSLNPGWYGLGLSLAPLGPHTLIRHGGSVGVATAELAFLPKLGAGVMVLANGGGYPVAQFAQYAMAHMLGIDPATLPFVAMEQRMDGLVGRYETYHGTTAVNVRRQGGFLLMEDADPDSRNVTILVPDELGAERRLFWTIAGTARMPAEFRLGPAGDWELIIERYKYRRTAAGT